MKVQEIKNLTGNNIMCMCIQEKFYTAGTNDHYERLLNWVNKASVTPTNIYKIAVDIYYHTPLEYWEPYGYSREEALEHIMFLIGKRITISYKIIKE